MEIKFLIENEEPNGKGTVPKLGIMKGYVQEAINQISLMELILVSDVELDEDSCAAFLKKKVMLALGDVIDNSLVWSRFDGQIFGFEALDEFRVEKGLYPYKLIARPPIWKLNFTTKYRSYPSTSRTDVISKLLIDHKLADTVDFKTFYNNDHFPTLTQIVQNEVSDLALIEQLMAEGGINYFFFAPKDGDTAETMQLSDSRTTFKETWTDKIYWNPGTGQQDDSRRISALETRFYATPSGVQSKADHGDGKTNIFSSKQSTSEDEEDLVTLYTREGQDEKVPKYNAERIMEGFVTNKVIYQGRSNHICIRSGEKVSVQGISNAQEKKILVASVRHNFKQSASAAMSDTLALHYSNTFSGFKSDAPVRPPQIGANHIANFINAQKHKSPNQLADSFIEWLANQLGIEIPEWVPELPELPSLNPVQIVIDILDKMTKKLALMGVWTGKVIEDAKVTSGGELVCRIANDQFPEAEDGGGLTARVALDWLTPQGWLSLLPRVGNYVYFIFMQGEGGQNEPVVIGYRSTGEIPTLDPAGKQTTPRLKTGEPPKLGQKAEAVVEDDEYAPLNRQRNTLRGEEGVAEVAVIDGADASVAIEADNDIQIISGNAIHTKTTVHCEKVGELHQQFDKVNRGVTESQNESIGKHHSQTVMGSENIFVGGDQKTHVEHEIFIDNNGEEDITVANGEDNMMILRKGEEAILKADDDNFLKIHKDGNADLQGAGSANISGSGNTMVANGDGIKLTVGGSSITISKSGDIEVNASTNVTITGSAQVEINGNATVAITGGAEVSLKGAVVNIN